MEEGKSRRGPQQYPGTCCYSYMYFFLIENVCSGLKVFILKQNVMRKNIKFALCATCTPSN